VSLKFRPRNKKERPQVNCISGNQSECRIIDNRHKDLGRIKELASGPHRHIYNVT
jgi:hypothetical protein